MAYLLIVDDDEDFATAAAIVLRNAGHQVDIELTPRSAMDRMQQQLPDLLVLDVMFPRDVAGGFELARSMRQDDGSLRHVPILMLTAVNQKFPLGFGGGDAGSEWLPVEEFVEKPVDLDVLRDKVTALLAQGNGPRGDEGA